MNPAGAEITHDFQEKSYQAGEVVLNYIESENSGPPLVLVHGLGRHWQVFLSLIPGFSAHWHILAVDLRGHGKSTHVPRGYTVPRYAEDITAFLRDRVQAPAVLFGHSLGGMISMWIAAHHPELVRALILGDNAIAGDEYQHSMYPTLFAGLRDLIQQGGTTAELATGLAKIKLPLPGLDELVPIGDLPGNDRAYLLRWAQCLQQVDPDCFAMTLDQSCFADWNGDALLHRIKCRTLLLQASPALGGLMTDADVARARELLSHCEHVMFPTLGHALYIQQPEPIARAVTSFLKKW